MPDDLSDNLRSAEKNLTAAERATSKARQALAAILRHDFDGYERLAEEVDSAQLAVALGTAFFLAADQLFGDRTVADVIAFVARARQRFDDGGDALDPASAERLIRAAAFDDEELVRGIDQQALGRIQTVLLGQMVEEAGWDGAELSTFLDEAREIVSARR